MLIMESIGARVRALRKMNNLKQDELGALLGGLSYSQISAIEGNRSAPTETLNAIAKHFKVSAEWLINGTGEKPSGIVIPIRKELAENPWKDALVQQLQDQLAREKSEKDRLFNMLERLMGNKAANFLKTPTKAGSGAKVVKMFTPVQPVRVGVNA